ncbi:MAG: glycosyltransferase family 2 protein [candidate division Zixibacteria bacterium]|nr:glycosyltransferase family 2 protein [candidate division Zixibacteria bacterium]
MKEKGIRTLVIIPVYNEENRIKTVLERFGGVKVHRVLVVNDGSTDTTPEVLKSFDVESIHHPKKEGVGSCIRDGIDYARKNGFELVVVMAGNGKDDPKEIPVLLKPILEEDFDYIQGSRYLEGGEAGNLPLARAVGIKAFTFLWSLLLRRGLTDVTNGFRTYKVSLFDDPKINIWQEWLSTYELEYYIHFWVLKLKYKFGEVPISKIYPSKKKYSKIRPFLDWWPIVKPLFYLLLRIRK